MILHEYEALLERVLAILFMERSWKRLVSLDTLYAFSGGPIPSMEAQWLNQVSQVCKYINSSSSFCFSLNFLLFNLFVDFRDGFFEEQASREE